MSDRPSRLYKYQTVTARTLENLKSRTLWFSAPSAFNDPFDCALEFVAKDLDDDDLARMFEYLRNHADLASELATQLMTDGLPKARAREVLGSTLSGEGIRPQLEELRRRVGFACLSAKNDDLLMWAHYADGHRGFCLEFDAERDPFVKAEPVAYRESVPEVNLVDMLDGKSTTPDALDVMLRTKFTCWQYEQEWRITYDQAGTAYNYPFDALTSVYLGASMPSGQRDVIGQLLLGSPVQLYQMKQGSGGFTVEPEPVNYIPYQNRGDAPEQLAESQETEQTPHTTHH